MHGQALWRQKWPPRRGASSCCTAVYGVLRNRAIFVAFRGAPALSARMQSPIGFQWLGAHRRRRCRACGIAERVLDVAGEGAIVSGMAGRYATALFELALEGHAIDAVKADLDRFDALVAESADFARLVRSPVFTAEEQIKALTAVLAAAGIGGLAARFLTVVASNRRLFAALDMVRDYKALVARHKGEVTAQVTVAEKPSDARL